MAKSSRLKTRTEDASYFVLHKLPEMQRFPIDIRARLRYDRGNIGLRPEANAPLSPSVFHGTSDIMSRVPFFLPFRMGGDR
jgi:hypothetical protein